MKTKMPNLQFLLDNSGKEVFVVLTIKDYQDLLEDLHDLAVMAERKDEPGISLEKFEQGLKSAGFI